MHAHLECVYTQYARGWPQSLCRIDGAQSSEKLPNKLSTIFFPDYGISLHDFRARPKNVLTYTTLWESVYQLVAAVESLHSHGVVHLDIILANVTLNVKPCYDSRHASSIELFPGCHIHPYLTLIDLDSAHTKFRMRSAAQLRIWNFGIGCA